MTLPITMNRADAEIETLVDAEALLLDGRRYDEWLALMADDAWYWIPADSAQTDPFSAPSHVLDNKDALRARVFRLKDAQNFPQLPPSRCSRVVGRCYLLDRAGDAWHRAERVARAPFHLAEALPHAAVDAPLRHFAGTITYGLVRHHGGWLMSWRRVDLIDSEKGYFGVSIIL